MMPSKKQLEQLRRDFPIGCRIVLDRMEDVQAPPIGTQGTCRGVDDAGNILMSWDTGCGLSIAFGADRCRRVATDSEFKVTLDHLGKAQDKSRHWGARCPRCGRITVEDNRLLALSRRADIMICESCGMYEGLEDAGFAERKPLREWAVLEDIVK